MATIFSPRAVQRPRRRPAVVLAAFVAPLMLALAPPAAASVGVGSNAGSPQLRVDSKGNAEVSFTFGGDRQTVLVPVVGAVLPGGKLEGADVSRAASKPALPFLKVLRRGPGGWFYALQTWPGSRGPVELRFSRWRGDPTKLTLKATRERLGVALEGRVTLAGKPIPLRSRMPGGVMVREYVYLDHQIGGKWKNLGGVTIKRNGSYRKVLYGGGPTGSQFRASVAGPNVGAVYAPDMFVQVTPP
jgi:hypothetical protein